MFSTAPCLMLLVLQLLTCCLGLAVLQCSHGATPKAA
jgi:hypothetical protein